MNQLKYIFDFFEKKNVKTKFLNKVVTEMNQLKYIFDFCEKMLKLYFENIG